MDSISLNPLSANPTKWSNTPKQFVGRSRQIEFVWPFCGIGALSVKPLHVNVLSYFNPFQFSESIDHWNNWAHLNEMGLSFSRQFPISIPRDVFRVYRNRKMTWKVLIQQNNQFQNQNAANHVIKEVRNRFIILLVTL